jgi:hypothetical protein
MKKLFFIFLLFAYNSFSQKMNKEEQNQLSEALNKAKNYAKPIKVYNKNNTT